MRDQQHIPDRASELGRRIGVFSDVHGELRTLSRALETCEASGVQTIALLGDLFDLLQEAEGCAAALADWDVIGVYGNHEREIALAAAAGEIDVSDRTAGLLGRLQERIVIDDVCLVHEHEHLVLHDPVARMFQRNGSENGHHSAAWITFAGHTHVRQARTERGPLDISRGRLALNRVQRYVINPGALAIGQFAIWDRDDQTVHFHQLEDR